MVDQFVKSRATENEKESKNGIVSYFLLELDTYKNISDLVAPSTYRETSTNPEIERFRSGRMPSGEITPVRELDTSPLHGKIAFAPYPGQRCLKFDYLAIAVRVVSPSGPARFDIPRRPTPTHARRRASRRSLAFGLRIELE
jgi:hypothetical protein